MRAAPNYEQTKSVNGKWKMELLIWLGKTFDIKIFCETGCCEASTLLAVHNSFNHCYSVELSEYYFNKSVERVRQSKANNITLIQGNSAIELRNILLPFKRLNASALIWLDAHSSGGLTANEGDPLPDEIKAIMELSPDSLVIIDDEPNDERVKGLVNDEWTTEFRTGIVFLYRKGLYNIPEFEN